MLIFSLPIYLFYCEGVLGFLIKLFTLCKVPLRKLTSTCKIPYLYEVFVLCLSYSTPNALNNTDKTFPGFKQYQIKNARNINANSGNPISSDNNMVGTFINLVICFFPIF